MKFKNNEELLERAVSLKSLPSAALDMMRVVTNKQLEKGRSEATSMRIGWEYVKTKFVQDGEVWVARDGAFDEPAYYTFEIEPAESFVTRTAEGREVYNYVLSDTLPDIFGTSPTDDVLSQWAEYINENQPEVDVDHEIMGQARKMYDDDPERVKSMLSAKKGIGKAIKANFDGARLIVSIAHDNRYKNYFDKIKGVSVEAAAVKDALTNKFKQGSLLGLSFVINKMLGNPRAVKI